MPLREKRHWQAVRLTIQKLWACSQIVRWFCRSRGYNQSCLRTWYSSWCQVYRLLFRNWYGGGRAQQGRLQAFPRGRCFWRYDRIRKSKEGIWKHRDYVLRKRRFTWKILRQVLSSNYLCKFYSRASTFNCSWPNKIGSCRWRLPNIYC